MSFKVAIFYQRHMKHQRHYLTKAKDGFVRHGIIPHESDLSSVIECDLACIWGHNNAKQRIIEQQRRNGVDYLVFERGYVGDRKKFASVGYNGLNGRAVFYASGMPSARWAEMFPTMMKPYRTGGEYILLIGQVIGDASLAGVDFRRWARESVEQIRAAFPNDEIRWRPHPVEVERKCEYELPHTVMSKRLLSADLDGAKCVVTFNSNTAVESVLAGVPTVTMDRGSMARSVTGHEIGSLQTLAREQWCADIAYKQWAEQEISNGDTWEHLKQRY